MLQRGELIGPCVLLARGLRLPFGVRGAQGIVAPVSPLALRLAITRYRLSLKALLLPCEGVLGLRFRTGVTRRTASASSAAPTGIKN